MTKKQQTFQEDLMKALKKYYHNALSEKMKEAYKRKSSKKNAKNN